MSTLGWTDDRVEHLKKLWDAGLSASQISAELGAGLSRNAVIGKVHRMGWSGRVKFINGAREPKPRKTYAPRKGNKMVTVRAPTRAAAAFAFNPDELVDLDADAVSAYDNVIPMTQRVDLMGLSASTCRWPIGDPQSPDFAFCGARPLEGLPYCRHHSRVAYMPASQRRRQPPKPIR